MLPGIESEAFALTVGLPAEEDQLSEKFQAAAEVHQDSSMHLGVPGSQPDY